MNAPAAPCLAYRIDEAADVLRISKATMYRLIARGKLKTVKVGRIRLVSAKALQALIEKGVA